RWVALEGRLAGRAPVLTLSRWATDEAAPEAAEIVRLPFAAQRAYGGQLRKLVLESIDETRAGHHLIVVSQQAQRLAELFAEEDTPATVSARAAEPLPRLAFLQGSLAEGWRFSGNGLELGIVTDTEVFGLGKQRRATPRGTGDGEGVLGGISA